MGTQMSGRFKCGTRRQAASSMQSLDSQNGFGVAIGRSRLEPQKSNQFVHLQESQRGENDHVQESNLKIDPLLDRFMGSCCIYAGVCDGRESVGDHHYDFNLPRHHQNWRLATDVVRLQQLRQLHSSGEYLHRLRDGGSTGRQGSLCDCPSGRTRWEVSKHWYERLQFRWLSSGVWNQRAIDRPIEHGELGGRISYAPV
jgi:hypothetical protein